MGTPHRRRMIGALGALFVFALGHVPLEDRRPRSAAAESVSTHAVVSAADAGPGTLREAILRANVATVPTRILLRVSLIEPRTPLPPLVAERGIRVEAAGRGVVIDGSRLGAVPLLDIRAPHTSVDGLRFRGAAGAAVLVRARAVRLAHLAVDSSALGVLVSGGGSEVTIEDSRFTDNDVALRFETADALTSVRGNVFSGQRTASIWAVAPEPSRGPGFVISRNTFAGDALGLVLGNVPVLVTENEIRAGGRAGIYVVGGGVELTANRVFGAGHTGIMATGATGLLVSDNEVADNEAAGILLSGSANAVVSGNVSYRNGYGIVVVFGLATSPNLITGNSVFANEVDGLAVVGGSPIVRENLLRRNRLAGIRILDVHAPGDSLIRAAPLLSDNRLAENGLAEPVFGVYGGRR